MFYSQLVLAKKGALGNIWLAAHMEKKVPKLQIIQTNIPESVENIENPSVPMALRVSGHLLLGVVRIFSKKVSYLLSDCSDALVKIKDAFRAPGGVELAPGAGTKNYDEITRQDNFGDLDLDLDTDLTTQNLFPDDDDALAGINIPQDTDLDFSMPTGAAEGIEEPEGFGADENYEVFFQPEEEEAAYSDKRQRTDLSADVPFEDDEIEVPRFQETAEVGGLSRGLGDDGVMDSMMDDGLGQDVQFEDGGEYDAFGNDEPLTGMDAVMLDPPSKKRPAPALPEVSRQRKTARPKRKMAQDAEIQLSTEHIRAQLADASQIVRDFDAEAAAAAKSVPKATTRQAMFGRADDIDPYFSAPCLSYLPSTAKQMVCFQPLNELPHAKKARSDSPEAAKDGDDEPEAWRSAARGEESGAAVDSGAGYEVLVSADEPAVDDLPGGDDFADGLDEPFPLDDMADLPADDPMPSGGRSSLSPANVEGQPDGFDPQVVLPDLIADGDDAGGAQAGGDKDGKREAWNPRTRKMYHMLAESFDKSSDEPLSYNAMAATVSRTPEKRKVVAGCFQELLFLTTHGLIELDQRKAYGNILISKTELFDNALTAAASAKGSKKAARKS